MTTSICDATTNTCIACSYHVDCGTDPADACNSFDGSCFPTGDDDVYTVGTGQEYGTIQEAVTAAGDGPAVVLIFDRSAPADYDESIVVTGARTLAFKAAPGLTSRWNASPGSTLGAYLGATVFVEVGSLVTARNSIIGTAIGDSTDCPRLVASYSAFDQSVAGAGNVDLGTFELGWFDDFVGIDPHLTKAGEAVFADVAEWNDGDPPADIDGEPRPNMDGAPDYAGADVP